MNNNHNSRVIPGPGDGIEMDPECGWEMLLKILLRARARIMNMDLNILELSISSIR